MLKVIQNFTLECIMTRYKERPNCRKIIEEKLKEGHTLQGIAKSNSFSDGIRRQAIKMWLES